MSDLREELLSIAERFEAIKKKFEIPQITDSLASLKEATNQAQGAFSGSWLGYHARVYYRNLQPPPAGANFSPDWGLMETFAFRDTQGDWVEYQFDDIYNRLAKQADGYSVEQLIEFTDTQSGEIRSCREELLSCMTALSESATDSYFQSLLEKVKNKPLGTAQNYVEAIRPSGQFSSHDMIAISNGLRTPPHIALMAKVVMINARPTLCGELAQIARLTVKHLDNRRAAKLVLRGQGTKIFIGHGRSGDWKDLKDFLQDRLHLDWEEFNRVSPAGLPNTTRLNEMLSNCRFAFLVMTAEDELLDGKMQARMNVIHEVGLFQSKLGFSRAIVVLEDGCEEFSNIQGLGQIRFPHAKISNAFEEIRKVLEREKIIE